MNPKSNLFILFLLLLMPRIMIIYFEKLYDYGVISNFDISFFEWLYLIYVTLIFMCIVFYVIAANPKKQNPHDFKIEYCKNEITLTYKNMYNFVLSKNIFTIKKRDFKFDLNGKKLSNIDQKKLYYYLMFDYYENTKNIKNKNSDLVIPNERFSLIDINENMPGIRLATDEEIKIYKRKIDIFTPAIWCIIAVILYSMFYFIFEMSDIKILILALFIHILVLLPFIHHLFIKKQKTKYYIIECEVYDTKEIYVSRTSSLTYIKVRDLQNLYIDNWFKKTYIFLNTSFVKLIVIKNKNNTVNVELLEYVP